MQSSDTGCCAAITLGSCGTGAVLRKRRRHRNNNNNKTRPLDQFPSVSPDVEMKMTRLSKKIWTSECATWGQTEAKNKVTTSPFLYLFQTPTVVALPTLNASLPGWRRNFFFPFPETPASIVCKNPAVTQSYYLFKVLNMNLFKTIVKETSSTKLNLLFSSFWLEMSRKHSVLHHEMKKNNKAAGQSTDWFCRLQFFKS